MSDNLTDEQMAVHLEQSQQYKIIRKYKNKFVYNQPKDGVTLKVASVIDFETTGKEDDDQPISIGIVSFEYDDQGNIYKLKNGYESFQEPTKDIHPEATAVNGLTIDDVRGKSFDTNRIVSIVERADFLIAHNAAFDRKYFDRLFPQFSNKIWCCSQYQIPWKEEFEFDSMRQTYIALMLGFFYEEHKAKTDCLALVEILSHKLKDRQLLSYLLDTLDKDVYYVCAKGSDFSKKEKLKEVNYTWGTVPSEPNKVWHKVVFTEKEAQDEMQFLEQSIYSGKKNTSILKSVKRVDMFKS